MVATIQAEGGRSKVRERKNPRRFEVKENRKLKTNEDFKELPKERPKRGGIIKRLEARIIPKTFIEAVRDKLATPTNR